MFSIQFNLIDNKPLRTMSQCGIDVESRIKPKRMRRRERAKIDFAFDEYVKSIPF